MTIYMEMPVRDKDGMLIGIARMEPSGKISIEIKRSELAKEWLGLLVANLAKGLKLELDLISAYAEEGK